MKILFLSHRIPFPPDKGDKIRSYNELVYLARNNEIFLGATIDKDTEHAYAGKLRAFCRDIFIVQRRRYLCLLKGLWSRAPFSVHSFYHPGLQKFVDQCLREQNIDIVFCYSSCMAEYVFRSRYYDDLTLNKTKLIIDFVDLDSDKWAQYGRYVNSPMKFIYLLESRMLKGYENKINRVFHESIFVAPREVEVFKKSNPEARHLHVISNGVDFEFFSPKSEPHPGPEKNKKEPVLMFPGVMSYFANVDGVCWFVEHILPLVQKEFPGVLFMIVGKDPVERVVRLARHQGVVVTGYVPDIRKYYWAADICVIPLRIARGIQNKVIEAMSTGNAVVATSNASEGIVCRDGVDILVRNEPEAFARSVIDLLQHKTKRESLGENAIQTIHEHYRWDRNMDKLVDLLSRT